MKDTVRPSYSVSSVYARTYVSNLLCPNPVLVQQTSGALRLGEEDASFFVLHRPHMQYTACPGIMTRSKIPNASARRSHGPSLNGLFGC